MRILIYNWRDLKHPCAGGAEVYTDAVASEWVKMGHSVTLFCAHVEGEPAREVSSNGYQIVRKGSRHGVYREAKKFWTGEGSGSFDLVIDEVNTRPFFCTRFVGGTPTMVLIHQVAREVWFHESFVPVSLLGRYVLEPWWLWRLRNAKVVTVSNSSHRSLEQYGLRNVRVVPEGYREREVTIAEKETQPTLLFLGRLSANKRPDHAIKAFEIVKRTHPDAKLWVIGDGPERRKLERRAVDGVEFLGRVSESEKSKRLSSAQVLLVTSVREGWGMVVTEAAFAGTPAIGYNVDGLRDSLLAHGGGTVDPSPDLLAQEIIKFLSGDLKLPVSVGLKDGGVLLWRDVAEALLVAWETATPANLGYRTRLDQPLSGINGVEGS